MIFLIISIIAAIILVGIALRRLPYLRTHRPGLEITTPRSYLSRPDWLQSTWYRVVEWWQSLQSRPPIRIGRPQMPTFRSQSEPVQHEPVKSLLPEELGVTAHPDGTFSDESYTRNPENQAEAAPVHSFWQDEDTAKADPLDLPAKGLVTRRGEAQKIAHELTTQADAAFRKKDYKEAEKFYLQAATKDPDNARIYNRLGVIYLRTKNYKDAVEAFRGSIKFDDRVASRHYNLALAYLGKKDYRSAEKAVREAIRLEPTNDKYRQTLEALAQ